ncbi:hypothetical protein [Nitrobacter hamburgensis]|uniref:hypothetical protein n=1 Tax=Nitrobacter hamburgensis TaxID=912 RepID=UPI0018DDB321|nr:hypothetical protein [Nitrobacter hamburgensis]
MLKVSFHRVSHQSGDLRPVHDGRKLGLRTVDHDLGARMAACASLSGNSSANVVTAWVEIVEFGGIGKNEVEANGRFRIVNDVGAGFRWR